MSALLCFLGVIMWVGAFAMFGISQSAMQEIVAGLVGVSGSVLFIGGVIVHAINEMHDTVRPKPVKVEEPVE